MHEIPCSYPPVKSMVVGPLNDRPSLQAPIEVNSVVSHPNLVTACAEGAAEARAGKRWRFAGRAHFQAPAPAPAPAPVWLRPNRTLERAMQSAQAT